MRGLLKGKLSIEEKNVELLARIEREVEYRKRAGTDALSRMEGEFRVRCLERIHVFMRLALDQCFGGYPVVAALLARGVMETAGLLALFEARIKKSVIGSQNENWRR